jgi:tRNA(Leu) C34 or U34 (ribose-2'-O)-methylase TrmL
MDGGYFGIGIEHGKSSDNLGALWRSAWNLGAAFIFVIGPRYRHQCSDTTKAWRHIPLYKHATFEAFFEAMPHDCLLVGVEFPHAAAIPLPSYTHPERAIYLLGAEDNGLSKEALSRCHQVVYIPSKRCLNVAAAGTILMYDRAAKEAGY